MNSYPPSNGLLLALPEHNLRQLASKLEFIRCEQDQILLDVDDSIDHVFFPNSGVISVVAVYSDGNVIEMAMLRSIGNG
jgi:CRP-like cAMP-binding protein